MTATISNPDLQVVVHDALVRRATERLIRLRDIRAARRLWGTGRTQREIAEALGVTQPRVHRMLRAAELLGDEESPEEIVLKAAVDGTSRDSMVRALSSFKYTFHEHAPLAFDGATAGTWDQVQSALVAGLLSEGEFARIYDAVRPPTSE